ncbi:MULTISPECIES: TetR/AcrR family transcriptional regulator [unclassified Streptomyces]|uniref:TetR/AcrR family transcriptional regulator n=1 Tax=unclassified Streptomyces TaxID=2593676 RepID=UPI0022505851|nr:MULTISPECIES: TetR/AcrR family transcriptional regulator [unclassified Streptomyces]WSW11152.1 TetR/AcrR family transcriptional regulator [Streptomyces sp. NBC_01005]WTB61080.1 TetR/AcrR family transcriptional regulator [Streptomyces sp. NBC_00826]WTD00660.1 TetR/AcrR family transcriptional regulator [Streptomyces sp. NBC_01650]WTH96221.1 TetR/AcrR family transcriptional regulator [Streptomyces sp. NBC_00825]WTI04756.1 TetR/AcrR family transcriptional regulator [Streptomyces sp. NBC_00822]
MSSANTPPKATEKGARPTRRAFDRDQALAAALREFWTHGYDTTSIASLTEAMGIRPPSLYAAFGDKRQLFEEAVELYTRTYGTAPSHGSDARSAIAAMLRHLAADYTDPSHPPGCLIITAATNCGPGSQDLKAKLRAMREETKAAIASRIRVDIDAGRLPAATDADGLAAFYAAVVQGMNQQACDGADRETLRRIADAAMAAWPAATPPTETGASG